MGTSDSATLQRRAALLEWYARNVWPIHRRFVKGHLRRRCRRCALSEAHSGLDADGLCVKCRAAAQPRIEPSPAAAPEALAAELDGLLRAAQGKGERDYDALVLFSGGKDSAFLVDELRRRYPGLRLVAVLVDNGYASPIALENAAAAAAKLDVDYLHVKPARSLFRKYFRLAALQAGPGKGCLQTVDMVEVYFFLSIATAHAASNRIPLIVSGLAWAQVEYLYGIRSYLTAPGMELAGAAATLGDVIRKNITPSEERYLYRAESSGFIPRLIHPFWVWRQREEDVREAVIRRGLIRRGHDSPLLTNHQVIVMMSIVDYVRLGYGSYEPDITDQVRQGTADRRYWQAIFEMSEHSARTGWMMEREVRRIAASIGLTTADLGLPWR